MKALIIAGGTILGVVLGLWPGGLSRPNPSWWRWMTVFLNVALVVLVFTIPTGGDFGAAKRVAKNRGATAEMSIKGTVVELPTSTRPTILLKDSRGETDEVVPEGEIFEAGRFPFRVGDVVILVSRFVEDDGYFHARRVSDVNPFATIPLNAQLEETARNLYFHVPAAWVATLAWFVAAFFGMRYLRKKDAEDDLKAAGTAAAGLLFCVLATVSGSFWARLQWGEFWSFDPRQVSIFATLVIFAAYFALRSALSDEELRKRLSAVYLLLLALPVVYFIFIFPRTEAGLHPGSMGSGDSGPVLSSDTDALNPVKQILFGLSMLSISLLFFWTVNVSVRMAIANHRLARRVIAGEEADRETSAPQLQDIEHSTIRNEV